MNWKIFLDYLKFGSGIIITISSYMLKFQYYEIMILIGGLIILSSGVTFTFGSKNKE